MTTEQQRKILEAAAKACGIEGRYNSITDVIVLADLHVLPYAVDRRWWNPITNSADCAEMCAKLEISTNWCSLDGVGESLSVSVICSIGPLQNYEAYIKDHDNSRLKAWMFAATMVAAKIGGYTE